MIIKLTRGVRELLFLTPVLREVRRRMPKELICVETSLPELFENNPFVDVVDAYVEREGELLVDLDLVDFIGRSMHPMDAYSCAVLGDARLADRMVTLYPRPDDEEAARQVMSDVQAEKIVACGFSPSVSGGGFKKAVVEFGQFVKQMEEHLKKEGYGLVCPMWPEMPVGVAVSIIERADLYVGMDNDESSLAMATNTPIVMSFTYRNWYVNRSFRRGVAFEPVRSEACEMAEYCYLKHTRREFSVVYGLDCPQDEKFKCKAYSVDDFLKAIRRAVNR